MYSYSHVLPRRLLLAFTFVVTSGWAPQSQDARTLICAARGRTYMHAHNDYGHARPLFDALDHGAASVEADVWLVRGVLLVAHDLAQTTPERTLEALYLRPLHELVAQGRIGPKTCRGGLQLLVDIKSEAAPSYLALHALLERYRDMLTRFTSSNMRPGAITVVVSGERDRALLASQPERWAAYDGRISDVESTMSRALMPLVSNAWPEVFSWDGHGPMPDTERQKLHHIVRVVHAAGRRVRFWATPEAADTRVAVWSQLVAAGVDYLNTDSLEAAQQFLRGTGESDHPSR